jgi:hypothetical protein
MQNMLVLDPRLLAPRGNALADPYGSFVRAYVHRIPGFGTGNRAFVANGIDEVAVAFGGRSLLRSFALPAEPPKIESLRLDHFVEKSKSLLNRALSADPEVMKRSSKDGKLEIVDPFSITGRLRFSPRVIAEATYTPPNQLLPKQFQHMALSHRKKGCFYSFPRGSFCAPHTN